MFGGVWYLFRWRLRCVFNLGCNLNKDMHAGLLVHSGTSSIPGVDCHQDGFLRIWGHECVDTGGLWTALLGCVLLPLETTAHLVAFANADKEDLLRIVKRNSTHDRCIFQSSHPFTVQTLDLSTNT